MILFFTTIGMAALAQGAGYDVFLDKIAKAGLIVSHDDSITARFTFDSLNWDDSLLNNAEIYSLSKKGTFRRIIDFVLDEKNDNSLDFYEYEFENVHSRWNEAKLNILARCTNDSLIYAMTDSLIRKDGQTQWLFARWDCWDIEKLPVFNELVENVLHENNPYKLLDLIAVAHNSKRYDIEKRLMNELKSRDTGFWGKMKEVLRDEIIDFTFSFDW